MVTQNDSLTRSDRRYALLLGLGALVLGIGYLIADTVAGVSFGLLAGALMVLIVIAAGSRDRAHRRRNQNALGLVLLTLALRALCGFIPAELQALRLVSDVVIVLPLLIYSVRLWLGAGRRADTGTPETAASGA